MVCAAGDFCYTNMDTWMEDMVSMMSRDSPTGMITASHIKKEEDSCQACSPSNSSMYSPTTTVSTAHGDYCDLRHYVDAGPRSPGSPDRQYCSSTTQSLGDALLSHIEEGMKEEDLPRRLCLVCGDVASGFHYGVASCEACKAFFKRTIQGNIEYTCPAANDCEINKRRRKACQACRFQKCLRMGMLKEGVRLDRVRGGRQKYRRNPELPYGVQHHFAHNSVTMRLDDNKMLEALVICEPELLSANMDSQTDLEPGLVTISTLSDLYDRELVGIIGWAKQIPGFTELSLNDQMRLLQSTWAEILTLTLAYRSMPKTGKLRFASDFTLDERQAKECGAIDLYNQVVMGGTNKVDPYQLIIQQALDLIRPIPFNNSDNVINAKQCIQIVERIEAIHMAKEEYYLIKALVLANSDVRLDEVVEPKKFRDSILTALTDCVAIVRPNTTGVQTSNLLLCLPALRQADQVVRRFWSNIHREGKVVMNKLFVEMLEAYLRL